MVPLIGVLNPSRSTKAAESKLSLLRATWGPLAELDPWWWTKIVWFWLDGVEGVIGVEKYSWSFIISLLCARVEGVTLIIRGPLPLRITHPGLEVDIGDNSWYSKSSCFTYKKSLGSALVQWTWKCHVEKFRFLPEKSLLLRSQRVKTPMRLRLGSSGQHWTTFSRSKSSFWFFTWRHFYCNCCLCVPNSPSPQKLWPKVAASQPNF